MQLVISEKSERRHIGTWLKSGNPVEEVVVLADTTSEVVRDCVGVTSRRKLPIRFTNPNVQQALTQRVV